MSNEYGPHLPKEVVSELEASGLQPQDPAYILLRNALLKAHVLRGVAEQRKNELDDIKAERYDEVTGLPKGRYFYNQANGRLSKLKQNHNRLSQPNSAIVIGADAKGLKEWNDRIGHDAGDELLRNITELFGEVVRLDDSDMASRVGGDEFLAIAFFNDQLISAEEMMQEIKDRMHNLVSQYVSEGKIAGLKWSIVLYEGGDTAETLKYKADPVEARNPGNYFEYPPSDVLPTR